MAKRRFTTMCRAARLLQRMERGRQGRKIFQVLLEEKRERDRQRNAAAIVLQKYTRGMIARRVFKINVSAIILQKYTRGFLARKMFHVSFVHSLFINYVGK